ncbi:hypothetical protein cyc_05494 [Cyclospora cayetanensis]|nr:hypothetical protein cyc_05494 [Cyclospora cayetanensis]
MAGVLYAPSHDESPCNGTNVHDGVARVMPKRRLGLVPVPSLPSILVTLIASRKAYCQSSLTTTAPVEIPTQRQSDHSVSLNAHLFVFSRFTWDAFRRHTKKHMPAPSPSRGGLAGGRKVERGEEEGAPEVGNIIT